MATIDRYKQIQEKLAQKKASNQSLSLTQEQTQAAIDKFGADKVNTALSTVQNAGVGINTQQNSVKLNTPKSMPIDAPETMPAVPTTGDVTAPAPITPEAPVKPQVEPIKQEVKTEAPTMWWLPPKWFKYGNVMDSKTGLPQLVNINEDKRMKELSKNKSLYTNGKSIYDAVTSWALKPWTQAYSDLAESNPNAIAEYNAIKKANDQQKAVKTLGDAIVGKPVTSEPTNLDNLLNQVSQGLDEDIMTTYKNLVTNDPKYIEANQKVTDLNTQMANVNNNINQLGTDIRKAVTGETPESVIASKIAREAKPLIDQAQYISDQLENAKAEATRISTENKDMFEMQMADRADKRNLAFKLYDTIKAEEIRQEDIQREDERIEKEIALEEYRYQRELADWNAIRAEERKNKLEDLRMEQEYNLQTGLLQLGVDPTGMTPEEMKGAYAQSIQQTAQFDRALAQWELELEYAKLYWATNTPTTTAPAPSREPKIQSQVQDGKFIVDIENGATPRKSERGYYECGMLVNDTLGISMPDLHEEKLRYNNSNVPVVWGAFIEKTNDKYGHTGLIESINADWTLNIIETNYPLWAWVSRKTIDPKKRNMVGYYDPQQSQEQNQLTTSDIAVFNNTTYKPQSEKDPVMKQKFQQFLDNKNQVMKSKDASIEEVMAYSQWGKDLTDSDTKTITKFSQALDQIDGITKQIQKTKTWPIFWRIASLNPYNTDAQTLSAALSALIPNLARWVYGEVGVLTDNDIRNYARTVPNLTQTKDVNNAVLALTLDTIAGGYKRQLQTLAAAGKDISWFAGIYENIKWQADAIRATIPWFNDAQIPDISDDEIESIRSSLNAPKTAYDLLPSTKFSNLY